MYEKLAEHVKLQVDNDLQVKNFMRSLPHIAVALSSDESIDDTTLLSLDIYSKLSSEFFKSDEDLDASKDNLSFNLETLSNSVIRSVYMDESDNKGESIVSLIIGIKVNESSTPQFFKIEMVDENCHKIALLKSHSYHFVLTSLNGIQGYATKYEALNNEPQLIDYSLDVIDCQQHHVVLTNGQHLLCFDKKHFEFAQEGGVCNWLIYTDSLRGWCIDADSFIIDGVKGTQPSDLSVCVQFADIEVNDGAGLLNYYLTVQLGASCARHIQFDVKVKGSDVNQTISIEQK